MTSFKMTSFKFFSFLALLITIATLSSCSSKNQLPPPPEKPSAIQSSVYSKDDPTWGQASAPVKIVVFADFQCPYCAELHKNLEQLKSYVDAGKVQIQYRDYPISSHVNSLSAHTAASAAYKQGSFLEMQRLLYENQFEWEDIGSPQKYFVQLAEQIGLDMQKYSDDYNDLAARKEIQEDRDEGRDAGVLGTPAFFINDKIYQGALSAEELGKEVELALKS